MDKKRLIKLLVIPLLLGFSLNVQARIDAAGLELIRAYIAQGQGGLRYDGIVVKGQEVAGPSERDAEKFSRSRRMLQGEMQHWNSRIQIITTWPQDQAVRAIGDGFLEIVDLGHFYYQFNSKGSTRAEAVRRLMTAESDGIIRFITGMGEFEERFHGGAGDSLKSAHASMKKIAITNLREIVRFLDDRNNRALLDLYNENRNAYLNRSESRYAGQYLEAMDDLVDFEAVTRINAADVAPATVARGIASYDEQIQKARELLELYLKEQHARGNSDHAARLQQSFKTLLEDFERSREGFRNKFPTEARRQGL